MKNVTISVSDCPMWKRLDIGTVLMMPDVPADEAIANNWAENTVNNSLLLGERIRIAKENK